jgi:hypothetical protein
VGRLIRYLSGYAALATWLLVGISAAQEVSIEANVARHYRSGDEGTLTINLQLEDPEAVIGEAVLFLSVIRLRDTGGYVQATHQIFASAKAEPDIFLTVVRGETLRAGIMTDVIFQLQNRIKLGRYVLVLQLFAGTNTNPHRVSVEERIAMEMFRFRIVKP